MGMLSSAKNNQVTIGPIIRAHTKYLIKANEADDSHRDGKLHPSMIAGCPTAAVIGILLLQTANHDPNLLRIFGLGTAIHIMLQAELQAAGVIATLNDGSIAIEVPLSMPEYDLVGHADGIVWITKDKVGVLEIKSINSMAFAKLEEPKPEHKIQAACYVMALADELDGSKTVVFMYYSKNDSKLKEFHYVVTPKDEQYVLDRIVKIKQMIKEYKEDPKAPEPYYDKMSSPACRYCSYKPNCHDTFFRRDWNKKLKNEPLVAPKPRSPAPKSKTRKVGRSLKK